MENSINNSVRRTTFTNHHHMTIHEEGPEESSWTMYFEDFFSKNHDHDYVDHNDNVETEDGFGCYVDDSSMISDAASPAGAAAKKLVRRNSSNRMISSSKRRRIIHEHHQEQEEEEADAPSAANDLEDTASSPSNSPKSYTIIDEIVIKNPAKGETGDTTRKRETCIDDAESENNTMNEYCSTELKSKGLCLVPLSMLSTYLS